MSNACLKINLALQHESKRDVNSLGRMKLVPELCNCTGDIEHPEANTIVANVSERGH
jgi:hypothetical protein